jgi:hypothetical protein
MSRQLGNLLPQPPWSPDARGVRRLDVHSGGCPTHLARSGHALIWISHHHPVRQIVSKLPVGSPMGDLAQTALHGLSN